MSAQGRKGRQQLLLTFVVYVNGEWESSLWSATLCTKGVCECYLCADKFQHRLVACVTRHLILIKISLTFDKSSSISAQKSPQRSKDFTIRPHLFLPLSFSSLAVINCLNLYVFQDSFMFSFCTFIRLNVSNNKGNKKKQKNIKKTLESI